MFRLTFRNYCFTLTSTTLNNAGRRKSPAIPALMFYGKPFPYGDGSLVGGFLGLDAGFGAERFGFVRNFPSEALSGTAEVAEGCGFTINRAT